MNAKRKFESTDEIRAARGGGRELALHEMRSSEKPLVALGCHVAEDVLFYLANLAERPPRTFSPRPGSMWGGSPLATDWGGDPKMLRVRDALRELRESIAALAQEPTR